MRTCTTQHTSLGLRNTYNVMRLNLQPKHLGDALFDVLGYPCMAQILHSDRMRVYVVITPQHRICAMIHNNNEPTFAGRDL